MTIVRSEVTTHCVDDIPADFAVNIVYHNVTAGLTLGGPDWDNHANEVRDCFSGQSPDDAAFSFFSGRVINVKCYDMADPKPRAPHADVTYHPTSNTLASELGPRQVALCLSYYAGRNLPSERGRLYIGPFARPDTVPSVATQNEVLALGHGLFNVGGANVHWQQHSEKTGVTSTITNIWVDNEWDTQRRRLSKATSRVAFAF